MNTKEIALIITFAALTMALDPVRVPSMFLLGVYFRFCEIPIVAASLLFGFKVGVSVAILNVAVDIILYPAPGAVMGIPFVLTLTLSMLAGLFLAFRLLDRRASKISNHGIKPLKHFIAIGTLFRTIPAPFLMYSFYRFLLPIIGINLSDVYLITVTPLFALYAVIFSLYTIPIGYLIARTISRNLKVGKQL